MRFAADEVAPGMKLLFRSKQFVLGKPMPQTLAKSALPIGVLKTGYTKQFALLRDGEPAGAAWFYFYCSMEGKTWGILDELALTNAVPREKEKGKVTT